MSLLAFLGAMLLVQAPAVTPESFFVGRTEGIGTARVILQGRRSVRVSSLGRVSRDGALLIDQTVYEEGKPPRVRNWRLVRAGPNRFTGTITDARGQVSGEVRGNVLHLRYTTNQNISVVQAITLQPGGRSAHNRMTFRRFGLNVATYEETIRRIE